jgi:hypothetical protein
MSIHKINNLFSEQDLDSLALLIESAENLNIDKDLGRSHLYFNLKDIPEHILDKITQTVNSISDKPLVIDHIRYVEYSSKYGDSNLPPHVDGDRNNLVVDYQLKSNISWDLGINTELYPLEDNSALIFNANTNIHWRPYKRFQDDEYIRMIFFRFYDPVNRPDYSYLPKYLDHEMFIDAHMVRDSLKDSTVF